MNDLYKNGKRHGEFSVSRFCIILSIDFSVVVIKILLFEDCGPRREKTGFFAC